MGIAANNVLLTDQTSMQQVTIEAEVAQEEDEDEETRVSFYSLIVLSLISNHSIEIVLGNSIQWRQI